MVGLMDEKLEGSRQGIGAFIGISVTSQSSVGSGQYKNAIVPETCCIDCVMRITCNVETRPTFVVRRSDSLSVNGWHAVANALVISSVTC